MAGPARQDDAKDEQTAPADEVLDAPAPEPVNVDFVGAYSTARRQRAEFLV